MMGKGEGRVFWITGLSGAGKTTIATALVAQFRDCGLPAVLLDGDRLRAILAPEAGHDLAERKRLALTYGRLCAELSAQGMIVVCATISMFHAVHDWNRANISGYREIYLRASLEERMQRDPKGFYKASRSGALENMVGIDLQPEEPRAPDLAIDNGNGDSADSVVEAIWQRLVASDAAISVNMQKKV
jgi:adenylylsulfate kinase-like enzyme